MVGVLDHGLEGDVVVVVLVAVEDLSERSRSTQRSNRVPHPDHANLRAGPLVADVPVRLFPLCGVIRAPAFIAGVQVGHEIVIIFFNQSHAMHEAGQRAHRERAAAEAEEEELVSR